jgi:hypothetical protein
MKNYSEISVIIQPSMYRAGYEIWVQASTPTHGINFNYSDGKIIEVEVPDDSIQNNLKPFFELPAMFAKVFIKGVVDFASNNQIKSKDQFLIEGELGAVKLHLKDMQEITSKLFDLLESIPPIQITENRMK